MKREQQYPNGSGPEHSEHAIQQLAAQSEQVPFLQEQQRLDRLIEQGFAWEQVLRLASMREHLYENTEMHQRMAEDSHIQFTRWLYEQGEINEDL